MTFLLSSQNIFEYLIERKLCEPEILGGATVSSKSCKNFNLLVSLTESHRLLVKQERLGALKPGKSDFSDEWQLHQFLQSCPDLAELRSLLPEVVDFDPEHSIIVSNYLTDYCDLDAFYSRQNDFPLQISAEIGKALATLHRTTFDHQLCQTFFNQISGSTSFAESTASFIKGLDTPKPEIFGYFCTDALVFYRLYQNCAGLSAAIAALSRAYQPCCLVHKDIKFGNILLHLNWELFPTPLTDDSMIRLIDWESCAWGDPAFDLGAMVADYLKKWLRSLVVNTEIDIETALRLATTPLEQIQPALIVLLQSYLKHFPGIIAHNSMFLEKVMQFTGFSLIRRLKTKIEYHDPFDNVGICTLQVAKTLLCDPARSIEMVLGCSSSKLKEMC